MIVFAYESLCVVISLIVILTFIKSGVYSYTHRLLPLVLGLVSLYLVYSVLETIFGKSRELTVMEELLLLQILFLMSCYIRDFFYVKQGKVFINVFFIQMMAADVIMFQQDPDSLAYKLAYHGTMSCLLAMMIVLATYFWMTRSFSRQEKETRQILLIAIGIPAVALIWKIIHPDQNAIQLDSALVASELCIYYLIKTDQLLDIKTVLNNVVFTDSDTPTALFDTDFYYVDSNKAAKELYPKLAEEDEKEIKTAVRMDEVKEFFADSNRIEKLKDGKYYATALDPIYVGETHWGYMVRVFDITSSKMEIIHMEELKNMAEEQTKLKSQFLARMSHDLRSPLHAIIGMSDILLNQANMSYRDKNRVSHILMSGNSLLDLVNSILDFSKLEAGKMELASAEYSIADMFNSLTEIAVVNLESRQVDFRIKVETEMPARLMGDELRVREMIQNVYSNAVKFTKRGYIESRVSFEDKDDEYIITIATEDTGCGIAPERLNEVFGEYSSSADGKTVEGTGLGMGIIKQLAELMGGNASVESDGKSGTTVSITFRQKKSGDEVLPPAVFDRSTVEAYNVEQKNQVKSSYTYPTARVLVADDMRINREVFADITEDWKFALDMVDSGKAAVDAVRNKHYDLIFLDLMMPGMNGDEAAGIIGKECDTPMVLFSANLFEDMKREYASVGFKGFLSKPIDEKALKDVIEELLPENLRKDIPQEEASSGEVNKNKLMARKKILSTFVSEIEAMENELVDTYKADTNAFRIKVHGVKGASRQIGFSNFADQAEVMEMAVKAEHFPYIENHMDEFLDNTRDTIKLANEELFRIEETLKRLPQESTEPVKAEDTDVKAIVNLLKEGFDAFDIDKIEKQLDVLEKVITSDREGELVKKIREASDDFEYEDGKALTEELIELL